MKCKECGKRIGWKIKIIHLIHHGKYQKYCMSCLIKINQIMMDEFIFRGDASQNG